jgi:hypothetical protein
MIDKDPELARVLSNPENFLVSDSLVDRINLDPQEEMQGETMTGFAALLNVDDNKMGCPLVSYKRAATYQDITFVGSEEQLPCLFDFKTLEIKLVFKDTQVLTQVTIKEHMANDLEISFGDDGYSIVRVRLYQTT